MKTENNDPLVEKLEWWDRTILKNSEGEKVDFCMCSENDLKEVVEDAKRSVPEFVFENMQYTLPISIQYCNMVFMQHPTVEDGKPVFYKKIKL